MATRTVAYTALMTALVYVGTLIGFSSPQFYFNLGDATILIAAALLNPISAMIAGGLGAFLGDLTVYPATMVFTLVIKGLEGLFAGALFMLINRFTARLLANNLKSQLSAYVKKTSSLQGELAMGGDVSQPTPQNDAQIAEEESAQLACDQQLLDENSAETADKTATVNDDDSADESAADTAFESAQIGHSEGEASSPQDEDTTIKNGVFENTARAKKRVFAIKIALSTLACLFCTGFMMTGYFVSQTFFYGTYAAALAALPMDAAQAAISTAVAIILLYPCRLENLKTKL